jgi:uncharacterized protein (DUF1810 family)
MVSRERSLDRFLQAQESPAAGFETALGEIRSGGKRSHWIWYILPQLAGLGESAMSRTYAIADRAEAEDYLRDPALCERYLDIISAIEDQLSRGVALEDLMGSAIDAQKLASSLTLFGDVAASLSEQESEPSLGAIARAARDLLTVTASQGYPACEFTRGELMRSRPEA